MTPSLFTFLKRWNSLCSLSFPFWNAVQFSSTAQSCLILCNPMDWGTPGFPVHHQTPELAQTHVHRVGDATQFSRLLLSPSPPAFNLPSIRVFSNKSTVQGGQSISSFSISPFNEYSGLISLLSKGLSRVFSSTIVWKHQFFGAQPFLLFSCHIHIWLLEKTRALTMRTFVGKVMSLLFKNAA